MTTNHIGFHKLPESAVTSLIVDADSLTAIQGKLGWEVDIEKLSILVRAHYNAPRLVYFATVDRDQGHAAEGYHAWLRYRGFELVLRGRGRNGGPPTSPIPVEVAMEAASAPTTCHHVVMLTRNPDLESVGTGLRRSHRTLTLMSDEDCPKGLRCSATHFVGLNGMGTALSRRHATGDAA